MISLHYYTTFIFIISDMFFLWYNSMSVWPIDSSISVLFLKGDVYPVEPSGTASVNQILSANWGVLNDEDVSKRYYYCS